jgi:hypothetical protein
LEATASSISWRKARRGYTQRNRTIEDQMTDDASPPNDSKKYDDELKLHALLVDQLLKYQATIWQIPTALVIGNFVAIEKFLGKPIPLIALTAFNLGLIFVLRRMIKSQRRIYRGNWQT